MKLDEYVKHAMLVHSSLVLAALVLLVAPLTDTETIRTRAQKELSTFKLALDAWTHGTLSERRGPVVQLMTP